MIAFAWEALDRWYEEDEELIVHLRDPYHRIDVMPTSRHLRISLDGEVLAETRRAKVLYETGLPPRWYIPREDVSEELLAPSDHRTGCAYKGFASYRSVRVGDLEEESLAWTYREPRHEVAPIARLPLLLRRAGRHRARRRAAGAAVDTLVAALARPEPRAARAPARR